MAGTDSGAPFRRIEELEQENEVLRERLEEAEEDIDRLRRENEELRKELKAAGRGSRRGRRKPKADPKRPGRKAGQGRFPFRKAPVDAGASSEPPIEVPVTVSQCPCCGGELRYERTDEATVTDMPQAAQPEVKSYAVAVRRCQRCGQGVRGQHPDVAPDQYGAPAHRVGPRVKAAAHTVHYGMGVPVRKLPAILREFTGIEVTQSALTQDALKKSEGVVGNAYQERRTGVATAPAVYTDDTGWRIHGQTAHLMTFDTDQSTVFQIRPRHRNEEVRELIPADDAGVMVTDRGKSYDAEELLGVKQQKCLDHLKEKMNEVLEHKAGRARSFGLKLKGILREARQLWRDQRAGKAGKFQAEVERMEEELTMHLRPRFLKDEDNQRLLDGIGLQHDRGRVLLFLHDPTIEPTNNRGERTLRPAVMVRKLSHGSKNEWGAEAFAGFTRVIQTVAKKRNCSIIDALQNLFQSKSHKAPTEAHPPPG
ncbi:MAG: transposase [Acidobacteriia bacterium]|nr:transposase [Terriglobia bacterium]